MSLLPILACHAPPIGSSAPVPRLLEVPPPARLDGEDSPVPCARAAFEMPLDSAGRVLGKKLRLLGWEDGSGQPHALVRFQSRALASRWEMPAGPGNGAAAPESVVAFVLLRLDCRFAAADGPLPGAADFETRLQESLRARRRAVESLSEHTGISWSEHDLDCLWCNLETLRRGPFLHDAVDGWEALEPRLREAQDRDGGFWVCRVARHSHQGQFVFLDGEKRLLAVALYWLGE